MEGVVIGVAVQGMTVVVIEVAFKPWRVLS